MCRPGSPGQIQKLVEVFGLSASVRISTSLWCNAEVILDHFFEANRMLSLALGIGALPLRYRESSPPSGGLLIGSVFGLDRFKGQTLIRGQASGETVSLGVTPGMRIRMNHELQLKSLILAQPERWRRG